MLGAYVCRQCRTRLSRRIAPVRTPQWQPRATFISIRQKPQTEAQPPQDEAQTPAQGQPESTQEAELSAPRIRRYLQAEQRGPTSRYADLLDDGPEGAPIHSARRGRSTYEEAGQTRQPIKSDDYAQRIQRALSSRKIDEAWKLFDETYTSKDCKALTHPTPADVELLNERRNNIFAQLLLSVNAAFCRADTRLPVTPTSLLFRYQQLGIATLHYWAAPTIGRLTHHIIRAVNGVTEGPSRDVSELLHELLSVWRLFFQCMGVKNDTMESIITDWNLPAIDALPAMFEDRDVGMRLQNYHPKYVANPTMGFCAVYLYSISDALDESLRTQHAPFLRFLERVIAGSRLDSLYIHTQRSNDFSALPPEIQSQIRGEIESASNKAVVAIGATGETLTDATGDSATNLAGFYTKRIERAVLTKSNPSELDKLWREVEKEYTTEDGTLEIPCLVYNAFLPGYMILRQSQRSVEIWNHMIAHGIKPDIHSWNALLDGCAKAKDLNGLNAMWARLLNTGIEPDNYAWTTRVSGLMSLRQITEGLKTLDEMGKRWISAETAINPPKTQGKGQKGAKKPLAGTKTVNNCTKPSIEVINGAVSGIVQIRPGSMRHEKRVEFVQKILAWSSNFQIKPDAITYNSLIQLYLQANDTTTAFRILSKMAKDGLEGDIATHGMLLTTAFDNQIFDGQTEQQQTERILKIFDGLEASGMRMNDYVYATAIDRLLKQYSNVPAVRAIMTHMTDRRFIPSAYVYTSLVTHYFAQQPPNIREVDGIVNALLAPNSRVPSDQRLYDRLIEGYAMHAEVGKMMTLLTQISKQGKLPGWQALIAVVRALVEDGDYERARDVVRDVNNGEGVAKGGVMGTAAGEHAFWAVVQGFGLGLEEERMGDFMTPAQVQEPRNEVVGAMFEEESVEGQESGNSRYDQGPGDVQEAPYDQQHGNVPYTADSGRTDARYAQRSPAMEYTRDKNDEREPGSVDDEEDVHGFLTNEPEIDQRRSRL
jgi:pentatricopeptide repeat protein